MSILEWPTGISSLDGELYEHLTTHVAREEALMGAYDELVKSSGAEYVSYLAKLIGDDERRHHQLFSEWANALRSQAEFREVTPRVPDLRTERDPETVARIADELLAAEKADLRELRELHRDIKDMEDTTIWSLLLEIMRLDTEKHMAILKFIRDHARRTAKHQH